MNFIGKFERIEEEREIALKRQDEEEERIREENRRIKEWEDKFDREQKIREEELIKKFYNNDLTDNRPKENEENLTSETKIKNDEENKDN